MNIRKTLLLLCVILSGTVFAQQDENTALAFPGAEGFGRYTTGGRGGKVICVTNLEDSGEGSLRHALQKDGPRIIVFKVSGTIFLTRSLDINKGNVTIAGQTAPGEGITIAGYPVKLKADNIIIRYLRFRLGDINKVEDDAINCVGGHNGKPAYKDIIIDHCTMSWSTDECASFYDNSDFTMQWCIISESLANSIHEKGSHGYGGLWGGQPATFHHNLLAHHTNRTPRLCGSRYTGKPEEEKVELFNNVIYNYGSDGAYAGEGGSYNFLANYYKPGPFTATKGSYKRLFTAYADDGKNKNAAGTHGVFYFNDNYVDPSCPKLSDKQKADIYKIQRDNSYGLIIKKDFAPEKELLAEKPFDIAEHTSLQSARKAYKSVLDYAGASLKRDVIDARIVEETRKGNYTHEGSHGSTNGMIDRPADVGGWPVYKSEKAPQDTDKDGMPDEWEKANGLNPNDATDGAKYGLNSQYTNLEVYINSLVNHLFPQN